jgi:hypothetical protein
MTSHITTNGSTYMRNDQVTPEDDGTADIDGVGPLDQRALTARSQVGARASVLAGLALTAVAAGAFVSDISTVVSFV